MTILTSADDINPAQWQELIEQSATASFFQTRECYDFYALLKFMKPFICAVSENDKLVGLICAYITADGGTFKRYFSRRAIVPGGALLDKHISEAALQLLLESVVRELRHRAIYIELRNFTDYSDFRPVFEAAGFTYQSHLNFQISTVDADSALQKLSASKRRQLKQTENIGIRYTEATTKEEVNDFYKILKNLYKTKLKLPLFPLSFFEELFRLPHGRILVVKQNNRIIGGMVCVMLENKTVYEWFIAGNESLNTIYPSVVATWAGIEYAAKNGYEKFDFMGAGKPDRDYGVREFKAKFGGELVEHGRFLYRCNSVLYQIGKIKMKRITQSRPNS